MIPTIGIMIGGYIFLRCLEILATVERINSKANRIVVTVVAVCVLLFAIMGTYSLVTAGQDATNVLRGLRP